MPSSKRTLNSERHRTIRLVKTWLARSELRIKDVIARMETRGCKISRAQFENYFLRADRHPPKIDSAYVLALIAAFTERLTERERAKAGEALELARLTRLPFDQLANLARDFPTAEFQTAFLSYALPQSHLAPPRANHEPTVTLTAPLTDFIGRARELSALTQLLTDPTAPRLIALIGAGGCGKTRLALQAAADTRNHFANGVFSISLSAVHDSATVIPALAHALGLHETPGKDLASDLEKYLRDRQLLLLLDNLDQVVAASPALIALLHAAPGLKILATSRIALQIGEREFPVPPLNLPDPRRAPAREQLAQYPAIALFIARARAASPRFALTAQNASTVLAICARLDGLPLALELAAARVKTMSLELLREQLDRAMLRVLTGGARDASPRHQTMRQTIAWSYQRLTQSEKKLFARLAIFERGCALDAARAVIADDEKIETTWQTLEGIGSLIAKSLLMYREGADGAPRFTMLEPLREFAREQLADAETYAARHAAYFRAFALQARAHFQTAEQKAWLDRVEEEHANLRAALAWLFARGDGDAFMQIAGALELFWYWRGHWSEARRWLEQLLASQVPLSLAARAKAQDELGGFLWAQGDLAHADEYVTASLADWRASGDQTGLAETLNTAGLIAEAQANYARAAEIYREGLAVRRAQNDQAGIALLLNNLAGALIHLEEYAEAETACAESFARAEKIGHRRLIGAVHFDLGALAQHQNQFTRAAQNFRAALELFQQFGDQHRVVGCIERLAHVRVAQNCPLDAARLFGAAEALRAAIGFPIPASYEIEYAHAVAATRAQCDADAFARAWAEGRAWSVEQILNENPVGS